MQSNGQKSSPRRVQFRETCRAWGGWFNFLDPWIQLFQVSTCSSGCGGETPKAKDPAVCQRRTLHRLWHQRRPANENTQKAHLHSSGNKIISSPESCKSRESTFLFGMLVQMMQFSVPLPFSEGWKVPRNSGHQPLTSQSLPTLPEINPMTIRGSKLTDTKVVQK